MLFFSHPGLCEEWITYISNRQKRDQLLGTCVQVRNDDELHKDVNSVDKKHYGCILKMLEVLASTIRQMKENKGTEIRKEEIKLPILRLCTLKKISKNLQRIVQQGHRVQDKNTKNQDFPGGTVAKTVLPVQGA